MKPESKPESSLKTKGKILCAPIAFPVCSPGAIVLQHGKPENKPETPDALV